MTDTKTPIGRITLKNVRLAFPNLWEPTTVNNEGKPRFGASFLIAADDPQIADIEAKMKAVAEAKWTGKDKAGKPAWLAIYNGMEKTDKLALHDGDSKSQYDGYAGNMFISAASQENNPPTVWDRDKTQLSSKSGRPYAGCYVDASVEFWAQDNAFGKRINAQLRGVRFWAHGDAFSAARPADADEFEDAADGADGDDFPA